MKVLTWAGWRVSLSLCSAMLVSTSAFAAPPVQHIFSNGQPADANQVNQNFQELADRIEAIPAGPQGPQGEPGPGFAQINFDPYRHNFTSKTFRIFARNSASGLVEPLSEEVRTYDRSIPDQLVETRQRIDLQTGQTVSGEIRYYSTGIGQDMIWTRTVVYFDWDVVDYEVDYTPGITVVPAVMPMGIPWNSTVITHETDVNGTEPPVESILLESRTVIAQESITVNNVLYEDCIKVLIDRGSLSVDWYCAGYGLVKRVYSGGIRELTEAVSP